MAQSVARRLGKAEVTGSSPAISFFNITHLNVFIKYLTHVSCKYFSVNNLIMHLIRQPTGGSFIRSEFLRKDDVL